MEQLIIKKLIEDENYLVKVLPHLKTDYFSSQASKTIFKVIKVFVEKYSRKPTYTIVMTAITKNRNLPDSIFNEITELLKDAQENYNEDHNTQWLIDETEEFCKNRAMENAIYQAVEIHEKKEPAGKIEELVRKALNISFKHEIGINFFRDEDIERRYIDMTSPKKKIPSHLEEFNVLCGGGIETKALSLICGSTHSGKTGSLVSLGASYVRNGYNVLYVTMEMSESKISQLFDANFMEMEINDIPFMTKEKYISSIKDKKRDSYGTLLSLIHI